MKKLFLGSMIAASAFVLAACQTTQQAEWSEWQDITAEQSLVRVVWPSNVDPVKINRQARSERYKYIKQERWHWGSGQAYLSKLPGNIYYAVSKRDSSKLREDALGWTHLKEIGLTIDDSQIKRGVNKLGIYFHAVSDKNTDGEICFVYFQALPFSEQSGYESVRDAAGGFLTAYECQSSERISVDKMSAMMLPFVEEITMRD